jgi:hypothetical protein
MGEQRSEAAYLAGIWNDSLAMDLLWVPIGSKRRRTNVYLSPSWSWPSISSKITFPGKWRSGEDTPSVKVVETYFQCAGAYCIPKGNDNTGQVVTGELGIATRLFEVTPQLRGNGGFIISYEDNDFRITQDQDEIIRDWALPFYSWSRIVFLDSLDSAARLQKGSLFSIRIAKIEIRENSTYFLVQEARDVVQIEFSLLLSRLKKDSFVFERVGLLADGRIIEGHRGDRESWERKPSCFQSSGIESMITIV